MKNRPLIALAIVSLVTTGFVTAALTQTPGPGATPADGQLPAAPPAQPQPFAPGFDDLMTMLVQPRHIRLHYAGEAKNWEMAAAEMRDLRQALDRTEQVIPNYQGNDVAEAITTLMDPKMDAVDAAIAAADPKAFTVAYKNLTDACNECHTYLEHPFFVIKVPSGPSPFVDQDFTVPPATP